MTELSVFMKAPFNRKGKPMWINANYRPHWAIHAEMVRTWRALAQQTAKVHDLPTGLSKVHIHVHVHKTNNRFYDAHNLYPTAKAAIDGLVDHGLIPDDKNEHLIGPDMRHGEKRDQAGITITVEEIT